MPIQFVTSDPVAAPADPFAVGHLGELTQVVSHDLVDAAINAAGAAQKRLRRLPHAGGGVRAAGWCGCSPMSGTGRSWPGWRPVPACP